MSESVDTSAEAVRVTNPGYAEYLNSPAGKIITEQREQIVSLQSSLAAAQQRISDLEAQCARVQRDAERYEWLRELREDDSISVLHWSATESDDEEAAEERTGAPLHYDELDAAIDAAMAAKGDDWLTREARQIGLHSPACASVRFGQNECDCGAAMAAKGAG